MENFTVIHSYMGNFMEIYSYMGNFMEIWYDGIYSTRGIHSFFRRFIANLTK